ncbi:nitroreductase family protein [Ferrimicrobium sp.]|uniref:nitroreductase family protein n=1 Tax=Ferrimicrobium sp. TaxID=2926050 RepID=UPI00260899EB|nr:nitroreductase family protein [Ferrimicrobium sp.]
MEFDAVLRRRRMHRSFTEEPVHIEEVNALCEAALRAPSAGFTQGTELVIVRDPQRIRTILELITTQDWLTNAVNHQGLRHSQVLIFPIINQQAYLARYAEPDKAQSGMATEDGWPQPYWLVDASFATMQLLLKVVDLGLGASFMGIYYGAEELRTLLALPDGHHPLGILCIGHPSNSRLTGSPSRRQRRAAETLMHFEQW